MAVHQQSPRSILLSGFIGLLAIILGWTVYQKALVVKKDVLGEHRAYFDLGPSKNDEIVTITATEYSKFVVNGKNAAWFLLFNALSPAFQCRLCGPAEKDFEAVFKAIPLAARAAKGIHFGRVDLEDSRSLFQELRLETAPVVAYFASGSQTPVLLDHRSAFGLEAMARFVHRHGQLEDLLPLDRLLAEVIGGSGSGTSHATAVLAALLMAIVTVSRLAAAMLGKTHGELWRGFLGGRHLWGFLSVILVLVMTAGLMWCRIRQSPFLGIDPQTGRAPIFLAPGPQQQLGVETFIIAGINGICTLAILLLTWYVPTVKSDRLRRFLVYLCSAGLLGVFAFEVLLFRHKQPGYPFRLLI